MYRVDLHDSHVSRLDEDLLFTTAGDVWVDTENHHEWRRLTKKIYLADRPGRDTWLMDEDEAAALAALPEQLTVFRGFRTHGAKCWDWTLDRKVAEFFARRWSHLPGTAQVAVGKVRKGKVIAYFKRHDQYSSSDICGPKLKNASGRYGRS